MNKKLDRISAAQVSLRFCACGMVAARNHPGQHGNSRAVYDVPGGFSDLTSDAAARRVATRRTTRQHEHEHPLPADGGPVLRYGLSFTQFADRAPA